MTIRYSLLFDYNGLYQVIKPEKKGYKMKVIEIEIKNVYGKELIYAKTYSEPLAVLTGGKTLLKKHIEALKVLGFDFLIKTPNLENF